MRWIVYVAAWVLFWLRFSFAVGMFLARPLLSLGIMGFYAWK